MRPSLLLAFMPLVLAIRDVHDNKATLLEQAGPAQVERFVRKAHHFDFTFKALRLY